VCVKIKEMMVFFFLGICNLKVVAAAAKKKRSGCWGFVAQQVVGDTAYNPIEILCTADPLLLLDSCEL
jgi:hypothetical protein